MKVFDNYEKFSKFVGLIEGDKSLWKTIGIFPNDDGKYFNVNRMNELLEFVDKNPKYHIVTYTSDGDDTNGTTYDNKLRIVNRLSYCLADGSKDEAFLDEPF